jgi:AraC-type transcriptional regulator N-terminus
LSLLPRAASVAVVAQGRKQVELGRTTFIYDESRFLLTSVDLPVVSRVIEASEESPYLCLRLKLEIPMVGELLSRGEIPAAEAPSDSPAVATAETTVEFLGAFCRLMDLLNTPRDIPFLSDSIQREIIYRILQSAEGQRLRAIATLGDHSHRTAKAIAWIRENYAKPLRVDELAHIAGMGVHAAHSFSGADLDESPSVSEAASVAHCAVAHSYRSLGRRQRGLYGRIRKRHPVQPRVRPTTEARCSDAPLA